MKDISEASSPAKVQTEMLEAGLASAMRSVG